jgi:hypothetical protein
MAMVTCTAKAVKRSERTPRGASVLNDKRGGDRLPDDEEALDLTALPSGLWKAEHAIEGPCESNRIDEEECQEPYVR